MAQVLLESAPDDYQRSSERAMNDVETKDDSDGKVDAIAALALITIVIAAAVFWLSNQ